MATFELYKGKSGQFFFRLKAANGQTTLRSEAYNTKASAKNGVESVRKNAAREDGIELFEGKNGEHYFRVRATNGQVVGSSEGYSSSRAAVGGIDSVRRNAPDADLDDQT